MSLQTITDFDFGVGGSIMVPQRVKYGPADVSKLEVDVIVWLMLEQEFRKAKAKSNRPYQAPNRTQHDGVQQDEDEDDADEDSSKETITSAANENLQIAREYAEDTLQGCGISVLFDDLTEEYRHAMLIQLCRNCDLFGDTKFRTVPDLFRSLRSVSKFQSKFHVIRPLGKGQFGEMYHVTKEGEAHSEYALKKISVSINSLKEDLESVKMAIHESKFLKILKGHPNIVHMHDHWLEIEPDTDTHTAYYDNDDYNYDGPLKFYIQLEFCVHSLHTWKEDNHRNKVVPEKSKIIDIAFQLFNGLVYIHEKGILHLDINPRNILWTNSTFTQLKITDFGLAVRSVSHNESVGTWPYIAPECPMTAKSDLYSGAVTIVEVAETVFTKHELTQIIRDRKFTTGDLALNEMLHRSLEDDPDKRPCASTFKQQLSTLLTV